MPAENGRLILTEDELTGYHHAVDVLDRPQKPKPVKASDPGLVTAMGLRHGRVIRRSSGAGARRAAGRGEYPRPRRPLRRVPHGRGRLRHGLPSRA